MELTEEDEFDASSSFAGGEEDDPIPANHHEKSETKRGQMFLGLENTMSRDQCCMELTGQGYRGEGSATGSEEDGGGVAHSG